MSVHGGSNDATLPIITSDTVTADGSVTQIIELGTVAAGVLTRTPVPAQGAALSAASIPVVQATDDVVLGPVTETAPATDTASSGLNGRLQRIAQRLTSLIALLPAALGQGTMAQSLSVTVASDQTVPTRARVLDGATWQAERAPRVFRSASASAAGATAVWTPFGGTVAVGASPRSVAVTPDGARAYVANNGGASVSVIATATNTVIATVAVGAGPVGVAVTPDGARAYVANYGANTVSVISTATNTVIATVAVGAGPQNVAVTPDGARAYVSNYGANTVSVIATATNTVIASRWRLLRLMLVLTGAAAQAVAGEITVSLLDGTAATGIAIPVYVPAAPVAAPLGEAWGSPWVDLGPLGIASAANGNVLNVNLSAALTSGSVGVVVAGVEEL